MEEKYLVVDSDDEDDKPRYKYYRSDKILGKLYRAVDEKQIWTKDIRLEVQSGGPSFWDELRTALLRRIPAIGQVRWEHRVEEARLMRES